MGVNLDKMAGTVSFNLGSVPSVMKVTWGAIAGIESDLGCGMVALARRIITKDFGLRDLAVVLLHGIKANGVEGYIDYELVAGQVVSNGLLNPDIVEAVTAFCEFALSGGNEQQKKGSGAGLVGVPK